MNKCLNVYNVFPSLPSTGGGVVMILSVTPKLLEVSAQAGDADQKNNEKVIVPSCVLWVWSSLTVCLDCMH